MPWASDGLGDVRPHLVELPRGLIDAGEGLSEVLELFLEMVGLSQYAAEGVADHAQLEQGFHFLFGQILLIALQAFRHMQHGIKAFFIVAHLPVL